MSVTDRSGMTLRGRWLPRASQPKPTQPETDPGAEALAQLARSVLETVPHVLRDVRCASHTVVQRRAYEDTLGVENRAWRLTFRAKPVYCVLDEGAERELLRLIVGGAPRRRLSEIERRITGEAVSRMLAPSAQDGAVDEERRQRPTAPTWSCSIDLSWSDKPGAKLEFFMACSPPRQKPTGHPNLHGVALPLRATLSSACDVGSVARWRSGSLVRLQRGLEVTAAVFAGGRRIALGQLGSLYGERALKLTDLRPHG